MNKIKDLKTANKLLTEQNEKMKKAIDSFCLDMLSMRLPNLGCHSCDDKPTINPAECAECSYHMRYRCLVYWYYHFNSAVH